MLKIGDTVKVIKPANDGDGEYKEYIKIGSVCKVVEIGYEPDGKPYYGLSPINRKDNIIWFYYEDELEKGHLEWIKD